LLVGLGVGGERISVEGDLDRVGYLGAASFDGDVGSCPSLAELRVPDREVAHEFGEARIVGLARCQLRGYATARRIFSFIPSKSAMPKLLT
jgi:hypothetical protein